MNNNLLLGNNVQIGEGFSVGFLVKILSNVIIGKNVTIGRKVFIDESSIVGNNVTIGEFSKIGRNVFIGNEIVLPPHSIVEDGVNLSETIILQGSKHQFTYLGNGKILVGCIYGSLDYFLKNYHEIGIQNGYSEDEISEAYGYFLQIKAFAS